MIRKSLSKLVLVLILFFSIFINCSRRYESSKTIIVRSNIKNSICYKIKTTLQCENKNINSINVQIYHNDKEIRKILLGREAEQIKVKLIQDKVPLSFFRGHRISGTINFLPESNAGPALQLPINVLIYPWIVTNIYIIIIFLSFVSALVIINMIMLILRPEARGRIEFIRPAKLPWFVFPPSRVNHFNRNKYSIGSSKNDTYFVDDCPGLKSNQLKLTYLHKPHQRKKIIAQIASRGHFYYKDANKMDYIQDPNIKGPKKYVPTVPDYILQANDLLKKLLYRGYKYNSSIKLDSGDSIIIILNQNIVLKLSID